MEGFIIKFKPTQEAVDNKLKVYKYYNSELNNTLKNYKTMLTIYCMRLHSNDKEILDVISQIRMYLTFIKNIITDIHKDSAKKEYEETEDHTFHFRGWEFANICDNDFNIDYYVQDLTILATLVDAGDYFSTEQTFQRKLEEANKIIQNFADDCHIEACINIINDFKEFELVENDTTE